MKLQMDWPDLSLRHRQGTRELPQLRPTSQIQTHQKNLQTLAMLPVHWVSEPPLTLRRPVLSFSTRPLPQGSPGLLLPVEHTPAWVNTSAGEGDATCPTSACSEFALSVAEGQI